MGAAKEVRFKVFQRDGGVSPQPAGQQQSYASVWTVSVA